MISRGLLLICCLAGTLMITGGAAMADDFDLVEGWGVLEWKMKLDEAKGALEKAGIPFEARAMMRDGTTHLLIDRRGWGGVVYFDHQDRMTQVLFTSPEYATAAEAGAALESLKKRYGEPGDSFEWESNDTDRVDSNHVWRNPSTALRLNICNQKYEGKPRTWVVWEGYVPVPICRKLEDFEFDGNSSIRLVGEYAVIDMAPHKMVEEMPDGTVVSSSLVVSIKLDDGTSVMVGLRPEKERTTFQGRRVGLVGRIVFPRGNGDPKMARPDPTPTLVGVSHLEVVGE